ncbi:Hypothetical_protein [Hexamita inflata]|uniref:Hypothetical_protein n=1 Tax=Hexamita inflata TaxID=28002 RepID=A0AA86UEP2_9EUKA|nr:Hypothetical protein HINF_LOCUS42825 [Hexamita inflata]
MQCSGRPLFSNQGKPQTVVCNQQDRCKSTLFEILLRRRKEIAAQVLYIITKYLLQPKLLPLCSRQLNDIYSRTSIAAFQQFFKLINPLWLAIQLVQFDNLRKLAWKQCKQKYRYRQYISTNV